MAELKQKKPILRCTQIAQETEPYPTDEQIETLFNAWKDGGKERLGETLEKMHPEGWACRTESRL